MGPRCPIKMWFPKMPPWIGPFDKGIPPVNLFGKSPRMAEIPRRISFLPSPTSRSGNHQRPPPKSGFHASNEAATGTLPPRRHLLGGEVQAAAGQPAENLSPLPNQPPRFQRVWSPPIKTWWGFSSPFKALKEFRPGQPLKSGLLANFGPARFSPLSEDSKFFRFRDPTMFSPRRRKNQYQNVVFPPTLPASA